MSDGTDYVIARAQQQYYARGWMDAISEANISKDHREELRKKLAKSRHECYASIMGLYCVVCHQDLPERPVRGI